MYGAARQRNGGAAVWKRVVIPLVVLIAVDLVTKALALHFVSDKSIPADAPFGFRLKLNSSGLGVWATKHYAGKSGDDFMLTSTGLLLLVPYLLGVRRIRWNAGWTFLAGVGVFGVSALLCHALFGANFVGPTYLSAGVYYVFIRRVVSDKTRRILAGFGVICAGGLLMKSMQYLGVHVSRTSGLFVTHAATTLAGLTVLWLVRCGRWRLPALLFCAAALGNELSPLLPPHAVVDFFYAAVLTDYLGHGVMNVADLYFDAAGASACALALHTLYRELRKRLRGAPALDDEPLEN